MARVLLPLDDAGKLEAALRHITQRERASRFPVEIHVLHVDTALPVHVTSLLRPGTAGQFHRDRSQQVLGPAAEALARLGIPHKSHALVGDPVDCILSAAAEAGAESIVLVTRPPGWLSSLLGRSVAEAVLRRSPVPVEIVPIAAASGLREWAEAFGVGAGILALLYLALE